MSVLDTSVILLKRETTYGTYASPAGSDAMIVFDYTVTPMESEEVRRQVERGFPGVNPSTYTAIRQRHTFSVELAGSGAAGTPAFWQEPLIGCLYDAGTPLTGPTRVLYPLASAGDGGSVSIAGYKGIARHRAKGARGNAVLTLEERAIPRITFDFVGVQEGTSPMDASAPPALTLPTPPIGLEVSLINTVVQLGGFTLGVRRLSIDLGNKVEYFSTTGQRAVVFGKDETGDRRAITADAVFELPDPSVRNFFADILPRTPLAFSLVHGTAGGNVVLIGSDGAVLGRATYSVEQNRVFMNCPIEFVPTAAGNELTLTTA
jgi:hypothetical protein